MFTKNFPTFNSKNVTFEQKREYFQTAQKELENFLERKIEY